MLRSVLYWPMSADKHTDKSVAHNGKEVKNPDKNICRYIMCFGTEAKTDGGGSDRVFREK
jgi:hypothetical protein